MKTLTELKTAYADRLNEKITRTINKTKSDDADVMAMRQNSIDYMRKQIEVSKSYSGMVHDDDKYALNIITNFVNAEIRKENYIKISKEISK